MKSRGWIRGNSEHRSWWLLTLRRTTNFWIRANRRGWPTLPDFLHIKIHHHHRRRRRRRSLLLLCRRRAALSAAGETGAADGVSSSICHRLNHILAHSNHRTNRVLVAHSLYRPSKSSLLGRGRKETNDEGFSSPSPRSGRVESGRAKLH